MTSTQIDFLRQLFSQYNPTITWKSAPSVQELVEVAVEQEFGQYFSEYLDEHPHGLWWRVERVGQCRTP